MDIEPSKKKDKNVYGIELDEAVAELEQSIELAVSFIQSEFEDDWARAERYFAGEVDLPATEGRSTQVKTEVRDAIRNIKPNIMRTLLHARKPVEYEPSNINNAAYIEQQGIFVNQLFWKNDGYRVILGATDESLKKKIGPVKTYWESDPLPDFHRMTNVTMETAELVEQSPDCEISKITEVPQIGDIASAATFDLEFHRYKLNGQIRMEAFPSSEFFINRNATCTDDAIVHGHRRDITVGEAIEMGLEYDDWEQFDADDPELSDFVASSVARRGYQADYQDDNHSQDLTQHTFLLTECYASFDLDGTGRPQKYCFYLGGSGYTYIDHVAVTDWCIDIVSVDPVPFTVYGRSIADLTINEQDTMTSLLRATIDNAHMANNPRHIGDPVGIDFNDVMNNAIGAPIKRKGNAMLDTVAIPFTGQGLLPLLAYLGQDVEEKVGVTKAATGLDPNAMQSTDKQAVMNTIQLAQGQIELIVRNVIETGLIPIFKRLLRLSIAHMDSLQVIRTKGTVLPVDTSFFDPDLAATPRVGLGTNSPQERLGALQFVLQKQEQIIQQFGMDNPFCSLTHMYNTLEDMTELSGLYDVGRYFKVVTPEIEAKLAEQKAKAAEEAKKAGEGMAPMDPSRALTMIEAGKARVKQMEIATDKELKERELQLRAIEGNDKLNLEKDRLTQDRVISIMKIEEEGRKARAADKVSRKNSANNEIIAEQRANDTKPESTPNVKADTGANTGS